MNRVAMSEMVNLETMLPPITFYSQQSLGLAFLYRLVDDLTVISRYIAEISVIFLICQFIYRLFRKR